MGDWTELKIAGKDIIHFKNRVPVELLYLFTRDDYVFGIYSEEGYEPEKHYRFQTTVTKARHTLDERGITQSYCKDIVDGLDLENEIFNEDNEDEPYPVTYEIYYSFLRYKYKQGNDDTKPHIMYSTLEDRLHDSDFANLIGGSEWAHHSLSEVFILIFLRSLLDCFDDNASVVLPVHRLGYYHGKFETLYDDLMTQAERKLQLETKFMFSDAIKRINELVKTEDISQLPDHIEQEILVLQAKIEAEAGIKRLKHIAQLKREYQHKLQIKITEIRAKVASNNEQQTKQPYDALWIISGIYFGIMGVAAVFIVPQLFDWTWLSTHPSRDGLYICAVLFVIGIASTIAYRKHWQLGLVTVAVSSLLTLAQIIGRTS